MPLYKAWDVQRRKRKAIVADSYDEFVLKGEYFNSVLRVGLLAISCVGLLKILSIF